LYENAFRPKRAGSPSHALFMNAGREKEYTDNVLITDDENEAAAFLVSKAPPINAHLVGLRALGMMA
jgi:hypothetical protein